MHLAKHFEGYLATVGALIAMCAVVYLYALVEGWLEVWRQVRRFRRQLDAADVRDAAQQPEGSGREPPPR